MPEPHAELVEKALAEGGYLLRCDILDRMKVFFTEHNRLPQQMWLTPSQEILLEAYVVRSYRRTIQKFDRFFGCEIHWDAEAFAMA